MGKERNSFRRVDKKGIGKEIRREVGEEITMEVGNIIRNKIETGIYGGEEYKG